MTWFFTLLQILVISPIVKNDKQPFSEKSDDMVKCSTPKLIALRSAQPLSIERLKRNKFNRTGGIKNMHFTKINVDDCNYSVNINADTNSSFLKYQFNSDQNKLKSFANSSNPNSYQYVQKNKNWRMPNGKPNAQYALNAKLKYPTNKNYVSESLDRDYKLKLDRILSRNTKITKPKVHLIPRYQSRIPMYLMRREAVDQRSWINPNKKHESAEFIKKLWNHWASFKGEGTNATIKQNSLGGLIGLDAFQEPLLASHNTSNHNNSFQNYYLTQLDDQIRERYSEQPNRNVTNFSNLVFFGYSLQNNALQNKSLKYNEETVNNDTLHGFPDIEFLNRISMANNKQFTSYNESKCDQIVSTENFDIINELLFITPSFALRSNGNKNDTSESLQVGNLRNVKSDAESCGTKTSGEGRTEANEFVCSSELNSNRSFDRNSKGQVVKIASNGVTKSAPELDRSLKIDPRNRNSSEEQKKSTQGRSSLKVDGISGDRSEMTDQYCTPSEVQFPSRTISASDIYRKTAVDSAGGVNKIATNVSSTENVHNLKAITDSSFIDEGKNIPSDKIGEDDADDEHIGAFVLRTTASLNHSDVPKTCRSTETSVVKVDDADASTERVKSISKTRLHDVYNKLRSAFSNFSLENDTTIAFRQKSVRKKFPKFKEDFDSSSGSQLKKNPQTVMDRVVLNGTSVDKINLGTRSVPKILDQIHTIDPETLRQVSDLVSSLWNANTWPVHLTNVSSDGNNDINLITFETGNQLGTDLSKANGGNAIRVSAKKVRNKHNFMNPLSLGGVSDDYVSPTKKVYDIYKFRKYNFTRDYNQNNVINSPFLIERTTFGPVTYTAETYLDASASATETTFNRNSILNQAATPGFFRPNTMKRNTGNEVDSSRTLLKKTTPLWRIRMTMIRNNKMDENKLGTNNLHTTTSFSTRWSNHYLDRYRMRSGNDSEAESFIDGADVTASVDSFYTSSDVSFIEVSSSDKCRTVRQYPEASITENVPDSPYVTPSNQMSKNADEDNFNYKTSLDSKTLTGTSVNNRNINRSSADLNADKKSTIFFVNIFNNYTDLLRPEALTHHSLDRVTPDSRNHASKFNISGSKIILTSNTANNGVVQSIPDSNPFLQIDDEKSLKQGLRDNNSMKNFCVDFETEIKTTLNKSAISTKHEGIVKVFGIPFNLSRFNDKYYPSNKVIDTMLLHSLKNCSDPTNESQSQDDSDSTTECKQSDYSASQPFNQTFKVNTSVDGLNYRSLINETYRIINRMLTQGVKELFENCSNNFTSTNHSKPDRYGSTNDKNSSMLWAGSSQSANNELAPLKNISETVKDNIVSSNNLDEKVNRSITNSNFLSKIIPLVLLETSKTLSGDDNKITSDDVSDTSTEEDADKSKKVSSSSVDAADSVSSIDGDDSSAASSENSSVDNENDIDESLDYSSTEDSTTASEASSTATSDGKDLKNYLLDNYGLDIVPFLSVRVTPNKKDARKLRIGVTSLIKEAMRNKASNRELILKEPRSNITSSLANRRSHKTMNGLARKRIRPFANDRRSNEAFKLRKTPQRKTSN